MAKILLGLTIPMGLMQTEHFEKGSGVAHNSLVRIRHARFRCSITAIPIIFRKIL